MCLDNILVDMCYKIKTSFKLICIVVFIIYLHKVNAQENPCPDILQYVDDGQNGYGIITIPSPGEGTTIMSVELGIRGKIYEGSGEGLGLLKSLDATAEDVRRGRNIQYRMNFPRSNGFPIIISIVVNGDIKICSTRTNENFATWSFTHKFSYPSHNRNLSNPYGNRKKPISKPPVTPKPAPAIPVRTPTAPRRTPVTPRPALPPTQPPRSSKPNDGDWLSRYRYASECGKRNEAKLGVTHTIIGGVPVNEGEYPWMVAIYKDDRKRTFICGGSLVSNKHAITAAHCVEPEKRLYMELGKYDLQDADEEGYIIRVSNKIVKHPEYEPLTARGDIAIIMFSETVTFTDRIKPICLWPFGSNTVFSDGIITGWGRAEQGGPTADKPSQLNVEVVSQAQCDADEILRKISSSRTFCAGGKNKGPCHGDSGGGLYQVWANRWFLRGIISVSIGNPFVCDLNKYAVYADVAHYLDWLKSNLN